MRMQRLNLIAVLLLIVAVLGIYLMPRVNYDTFASRQQELGDAFRELEEKVLTYHSTVTSLASTTSTTTNELLDSFGILSDRTRKHEELLYLLERRIAALEEVGLGGTERTPGTSPLTFQQLASFFSEPYSDEVEIPDEIRERVLDTPAAGVLQQNGFPNFLSQLVEMKLVPFESADDLPADLVDELYLSFTLFKASLAVVDQRQIQNTESLVAKANEVGDYIEVAATDEGRQFAKAQLAERSANSRGITSRRPLEGKGLVRYYHFPYDDNPQIDEVWAARDNTKLRMFRDVYLIGKRYSGE